MSSYTEIFFVKIKCIVTYTSKSIKDLLTLPEHLRSLLVFWWGSCCLLFSFLCCVLCSIVCLFVFLSLSHVIVSLFSIYEFDCPFGIFRASFEIYKHHKIVTIKWKNKNKKWKIISFIILVGNELTVKDINIRASFVEFQNTTLIRHGCI